MKFETKGGTSYLIFNADGEKLCSMHAAKQAINIVKEKIDKF
jgi:hypothetical protein